MNAPTIKATCSKLAAIAIAASAAIPMAALAEGGLSYYFEGAKMHVRASSTLSGKRLVLLWDETDKGETAAAWAHSTNFVAAVPAAGGTYTLDLDALGISNGMSCRIASATCYERLTMLLMEDRNKYIDTGIQGKNVYGVLMGFYPTKRGTASTADANFALNCGKGGNTGWNEGKGGFHIGLGSNADVTADLQGPVHWGHHGYGSVSSERPNWETNTINHIAFTNRVFTLNGVIVKSSLHAGAICTNELTVTMGRNNPYASGNYFSLCGYWSYLRFDDENGDPILDYVPVKRLSDNKVGFWDGVSKTLVVPTVANQNLSAGDGTPTGEVIVDDMEVVSAAITPNRALCTALDKSVLTVTVPAGLVGEQIIVAWDSEDKGDDLANWSRSAVLAESATAGDITQRLGKLGVRNGDVCRVFAANAYKPLDKLWIDAAQKYVDTGILGTDIYGLRFGFYPTGRSPTATGDLYYCIGCGKNDDSNITGAYGIVRGGFAFGIAGDKDIGHVRFFWRGANNDISESTVLASTNTINEYAFTNRVFTLNGDLIKSNLAAGSVSTNLYPVSIGKNAYITDSRFRLYGWWSHVSFDDASGNRILDYTPVQRASDGKVGFYDRATLSFVASSGTGNFTAGTVTDNTPVVAVNARSKVFTAAGIPGLMLIVR